MLAELFLSKYFLRINCGKSYRIGKGTQRGTGRMGSNLFPR
jgi:hypothetical protein